jgi:uncharacterized protein (UPF0332 family)
MTPDQAHLLSESKSSIDAANILKREGYFGFAASRAYYAMFYAAQAILLTKGFAFSKHAGVIAAFGQHFVKTGEVPPEYHRHLIQGMELRHVGDYGRSDEISAEQCDEQIRRSQDFLLLAERILGPSA